MQKDCSLGKIEKLKSRKQLGLVFNAGKSFLVFPVKVSFLIIDNPLDFPVKAGFGVSTRYFKKAVDRNRVKRLFRECYRLNKHELLDYCASNHLQINVFFLFVDKQLPEFANLQTAVQSTLKKLIVQLEKNKKEKESKANNG